MSKRTPTATPNRSNPAEDEVAAADADVAQQRAATPDLVELERQAHPLAARLWSIVRDRSAADRRQILDALRRRLGHGTQTPNQGIAVEALRRFAAAQAEAQSAADQAEEPPPAWAPGPPSMRRYKRFRESRPTPTEWPSASLIAKAFDGTWSSSLAAAGLDVAPDVLSRRRTMRPGPFTLAEVLELLRQWIAERQDPKEALVEGSFVVWLEQRSRDPRFADQRFPARPTLSGLYDGWHAALRAVGALDRHPDVLRAARAAERGGEDWDWAMACVSEPDFGRAPVFKRRRRSERYSRQYLIACLQWLTSHVSVERRALLTGDEWTLLCRAALWTAVQRGGWIELPSYAACGTGGVLRSWPEARAAAGLAPEAKRRYGRGGEPYSEAELLDAVEACAQALGRIPERRDYERWRLAELQVAGASEQGRRLPSEGCLRVRLPKHNQRWPEVIKLLLAERPHLRRLVERPTTSEAN